MLACGRYDKGMRYEAELESGGSAIQKIVAVNGMSILLTDGSLSEPKYLVETGVTQGVTVNGYRHSRLHCKHYYFEQASRIKVWLVLRGGARAESRFWWDCNLGSCHREWTADPSDGKRFSVPSCSVAHSVTEDNAMDDSAEIPAARVGTVPPVRRRASISDGDRGELYFDRVEPQKFVVVNWFSIQVLASN